MNYRKMFSRPEVADLAITYNDDTGWPADPSKTVEEMNIRYAMSAEGVPISGDWRRVLTTHQPKAVSPWNCTPSAPASV